MPGIYRIRNLRSKKSYIGQAALRFEKRFKEHRHYLRHGNHHSKHLQRAWDRYGEHAFAFEVIEEIPQGRKSEDEFKKILIEREQFYIDTLKTADPFFGYNVSPRAGTQLGYRHSEESRCRMSEAGRGRKLPDEWRQSIADSMKAKRIKRSQAERDRLSATRAQLRKEEVFDALDMYEEGVSQEQIAERFGLSTAGVSRIIRGLSYRKVGEDWCRARGIEMLPNRPRAGARLSRDEIFDILDRDEAGEMRQTIAKIYDASLPAVTAICRGKYYTSWFEEWCQLRGVVPGQRTRRKTKKLSEDDVRNIRDDLASGMKQRDIARKHGVTAQTICDIKKGRTHGMAKRKCAQ